MSEYRLPYTADEVAEKLRQVGAHEENIADLTERSDAASAQIREKIGEVVFEEDISDAFKFSLGYLNKSGTVVAADYGGVTDFIPVEIGDVFYWTGSSDHDWSYGVCEYDADKKFIKGDTLSAVSYISSQNVKYTVSEGAYVRFSTVQKTAAPVLYKSKEYDGISKLVNKTEEYLTGAENKFVHKGTGTPTDESNSKATQYIPAREKDVFLVTGRSQYETAGVCFYDSGYNKIKTALYAEDGSKYVFTKEKVVAPVGTAYVRFSTYYYENYPLKVWKYEQLPLVHADYQLYEYVSKSNCLFGKKYVACGDSFTAGDFPEKNEETWDERNQTYKTYCWHIADRNNMTLVNEARSGSTMYNNGSEAAFSVTRYTQVSKDADYITICFGLNETNAPIGTLQDTTNETVMGSWNVVLEYFITHMPYAKIGIIIPDAWCSAAMREALIAVAEYWGIPYLDTTGDPKVPLLIGGKRGGAVISTKAKELRNAAFQVSAEDSHPNAKGHLYRSTVIENFMRSL